MRALLIAMLLAGCAIEPKMPIAVSCVKQVPVVPQTTDETALKAMDDYAATLTTWTERLLLKAYSLKADAVIQACK